MKKIFKSIMLVAAAAMAFASCQKEENVAPETISATLTMHADVEATKTYLGEDNTVLWGTGESVKLYVGAGETAKFVSSTSTNAYEGQASATFSFTIEGVEESNSYSLGGIYPASAAVASSNTNPAKYKVQLPATQQSVDGNYDPSAYIMVLKPGVVDELPVNYQAYFRRATALNKITLTGVKENISSVEITVPEGKYLAGRRYFDLTEGTSGEVYYGQSNTITVNAPFTGPSIDVWFCSWGVELAKGDKLTVKIVAAENTYTRTITANESGISFVEGNLNKLKINMADVNPDVQEQPVLPDSDKYYEKVTSKLDNWSGKYLIVYESDEKAYIFNGKDEVNGYVSATISGNKIASTSEVDDVAVTIETMSGGYAIKTIGGYIYGDSNSNKLSFSPSGQPNTIQYSSSNDVTIESGRVLRFNNTSNQMRFRYYSSGTQQPIQLYILVESSEGGESPVAPTPDPEEPETPVEPEPEEPVEPQVVTVAEFLAAEVGVKEFQLTGVMSGTYNTTYGNFYIEDETGKVLVYGLTKTKVTENDKSFATIGLRDGDVLTLIGQRAEYNSTAQVGGPAYYVSHVAAPYFELAATSGNVAYDETTYTVNFESNLSWTVSSSTGVTLNPTSGTGNGSVVMTFAANETDAAKTHTVTFTAGENTAVFTLTQSAKPAEGGAETPSEPVVLLSENFSSLNTWSTSDVSSLTVNGLVWTRNSGKMYAQNGCIKFGSGTATSNTGVKLPKLTSISGTTNVRLTFKAVSSAGAYTISVKSSTGSVGTLAPASITKYSTAINSGASTANALNEAFAASTYFSVDITGVTSATDITITVPSSAKQWYIDDVKVVTIN